jgi:hypothetical protein
MTERQKKNALLFYNRLTASNLVELNSISIAFVSCIDETAIKRALVLSDVSGGSYTALALKYNATKYQVRYWLKEKAVTN